MIKECVVCGAKFETAWKQQVVCSDECRVKHIRERVRVNYHKNKVECKCKHCGKTFLSGNPESMFCGTICRNAAKAEAMPPEEIVYGTCAYCGKKFPMYDKRQKYCDKACSLKAVYDRKLANKNHGYSHYCLDCRKEYTSESATTKRCAECEEKRKARKTEKQKADTKLYCTAEKCNWFRECGEGIGFCSRAGLCQYAVRKEVRA